MVNSSKSKALHELMANNHDLTTKPGYDNSFMDPPTGASAGSVVPDLDEVTSAMIILAGARVRWNWNYWIVTRRDGSRRHLHKTADLKAWQDAVIASK